MDAFWLDVQRIAEPFGGYVDNCGLIDDDHVPFSDYR